jgi:hypothetical protein
MTRANNGMVFATYMFMKILEEIRIFKSASYVLVATVLSAAIPFSAQASKCPFFLENPESRANRSIDPRSWSSLDYNKHGQRHEIFAIYGELVDQTPSLVTGMPDEAVRGAAEQIWSMRS